MQNQIKKFLEFNGKAILFLHKDGQYWVAIKPICEALEVDYNRAQKNIRTDQILNQLCAKQHIVGADNKLREMLCFPEKYIYGWLFSINSSSKALLDYKRKCYDILYTHFHGSIARRQERLLEKAETYNRIETLEKDLRENLKFLELEELKAKQMRLGKSLKQLDHELLTGQTFLF
jgi:hypothetical protein